MAKNTVKPVHSLKIPMLILITGKVLQIISPKLAATFAARLFTSPFKYKIPKRELEMDRKSRQESVHVDSIGKRVVVYHFGQSDKKILLVHGWSGRGTQLVKFADECVKNGYATVSFDAPAHGKSSGKTTLMPEFIAAILQLEKQFGPFYAAIGHSLGGMSLLNSVKGGLKLNRLVIIGSGDIVQDIIDDFIKKIQLRKKVGVLMRKKFEDQSKENMDNYSSFRAAKQAKIPVLVIHDKDDDEVPVGCAYHIAAQLSNGELLLTNGLGHRKILGNQAVIERSINFIKT